MRAISVLSFFVATVQGAVPSPSVDVGPGKFPKYEFRLGEGPFTFDLKIVIRQAEDRRGNGVADFLIKLRFPDGSEVEGDCPEAPYKFEDGQLKFDRRGTCAGKFCRDVNATFKKFEVEGDVIEESPTIDMDVGVKTLTVNIVMPVVIPFTGFADSVATARPTSV